MTAVVIREARPADADAIAAVHKAAVLALRGRDPYSDAEIDAWAQTRPPEGLRELMTARLFLVADGPDGLLAYSVLDLEVATLRSVYVHPAAQGRGLGRRLVREAIANARRSGLAQLELDAAPTSVSFYEGLGFFTLGHTEHRFRSGACMTCVHMTRDLSGDPR